MNPADTIMMTVINLCAVKGAIKNITPLMPIAWGNRKRITKIDTFEKKVDPSRSRSAIGKKLGDSVHLVRKRASPILRTWEESRNRLGPHRKMI